MDETRITPEGRSGTAREAPCAGSGAADLQSAAGTQSAAPNALRPPAANPFAELAELAEAECEEGDREPGPLDQVWKQAAELWELFGACGAPAEATLARRALQEAVFWAGQAHLVQAEKEAG